MDYEIFPLAYTQADWNIFNKVSQASLGVSVSRGIDACYLDLKDPGAYLGSLDFDNDPLYALRHKPEILQHFSMSFIARLDDHALLEMQRKTRIKVFSKEANRRSTLAILTADMVVWKAAITESCQSGSDYSLRWLMSRIFDYLQQTGLRELFTDYTKTDLQDGTIALGL